jgi:Tfp pilus assembly protein PilN
MQSLDLNLATRPFRNNTLLWIGYSLAVVLLGVFTAWNVMAYQEHRTKLRELRADIESFDVQEQQLEVRGRRAQNAIDKYDLVQLGMQADKANEVIEWKAFSWTRLFNRMTDIMPYDVKMTAIRPIFRLRGRNRADELDVQAAGAIPVSVEGLGKNFEAVFSFQNALLASRYFGRVEPGKLRRTEDKRELLFELRFLYYQDVADEPPAEALEAVEEVGDGAEMVVGPLPATAELADGVPAVTGAENPDAATDVTRPAGDDADSTAEPGDEASAATGTPLAAEETGEEAGASADPATGQEASPEPPADEQPAGEAIRPPAAKRARRAKAQQDPRR